MKKFLQKKSLMLMTPFLCGLCFLTACGNTPPPTTPPSGGIEPKQVMVQLKHEPSGTADLKWNAQSHELSVTVTMSGLQAKTIHPAHIHSGSCAKPSDAVVYPLDNVVADADGNAKVTTVIQNVANGITASGWYINVHNGPDMMTADQKMSITCGDISNPNASATTDQSVTSTLAGTTAPNQSASGTAQLMISDTTVTVAITLNGLVPNSSHIAHLHEGSCEQQGKVAFMLKPIVADASGVGHSTTEIPLSSLKSISSLYVNVHFGDTMEALKTQPGYDGIACGNVVGLN